MKSVTRLFNQGAQIVQGGFSQLSARARGYTKLPSSGKQHAQPEGLSARHNSSQSASMAPRNAARPGSAGYVAPRDRPMRNPCAMARPPGRRARRLPDAAGSARLWYVAPSDGGTAFPATAAENTGRRYHPGPHAAHAGASNARGGRPAAGRPAARRCHGGGAGSDTPVGPCEALRIRSAGRTTRRGGLAPPCGARSQPGPDAAVACGPGGRGGEGAAGAAQCFVQKNQRPGHAER